MPNLQLAVPGKREHHGPVVANDRHGTGFGSSLLSIRTDTRLSDVEACRRRIIIDLSGSSRAGLPQPVLRRNQSLEPTVAYRSCWLSSRFPSCRLRIPRPSRNRAHGADYSVVKVRAEKASHIVISRETKNVRLD